MSFVSIESQSNKIGYLTLDVNGAILASGGDLENAEALAETLYRLVSMQDKIEHIGHGCVKLSVNFKEHSYVACLSNKKIYIVKKKLDLHFDEDNAILDIQVPNNNSINS